MAPHTGKPRLPKILLRESLPLPVPSTTQDEIGKMAVIQTVVITAPPPVRLKRYMKTTEPPREITSKPADNVMGPTTSPFATLSPAYISSKDNERTAVANTAAICFVPSSASSTGLSGSPAGVASASPSVPVVADKYFEPSIEHPSSATRRSISISTIPDDRGCRISHVVSFFRDRSYVGNTPDKQLLLEFRQAAVGRLRLSPRRLFSLRRLKHIYVTDLSNPTSPIPSHKYADAAREHDLLCAFERPDKISSEIYWVVWMDKLNKSQHGLEFVMGWDVRKILVLTMGPWIASLMTAIVWVVGTGDIQSAMAVATYILTLSGVFLTLLGVLGTLKA